MPPDAKHEPRLEPTLISIVFDEQRIWRTWVSLERVPEPVREAIVAAEDRRFYSHAGVDVRATLRALTANVRSGGVRQGGSTITQQLARGLFLGRERTMSRKLAEIPLAHGLEVLLSKRDILEMYLNSIYWGQAQSFGIGGVEQAARWYFDAPVDRSTSCRARHSRP
jgi:membrane peptidoglycan carboxypeptidase